MMRGDAALRELVYGAEESGRSAENLARVEQIAADVPSLPCTFEVARWYGQIKETLRKKGRPIPQNDLWIAATALRYGLVLLTRDQHFDELDALRRQGW